MVRAPRLEVFVVVKGHAFSRDAFEAMLRAIDVEPTMVDQPAAATLLNPDAMRRYDAVLFYDMPGMDFRAPMAERPAAVPPEPSFMAGFEALLAEGKGIVALHHAIAGWPAWPAYAEALGGAFLYKPKTLRGAPTSDSGFAADVEYDVRIAATGHPVLAGMPTHFTLRDELYLHSIFEDSIEPLLWRTTPVGPAQFQSATRAVRRLADGEGEPWLPPEGSDVIGWAKAAGNSPLVYLQPGDGRETYADPNYRLLVGNALRWVASAEARTWAAARNK
jgi:type 1 glutamine amidotransferase